MSSLPPVPPARPGQPAAPNDPYAAHGQRPRPAHLDPWVAEFSPGAKRRWGTGRSKARPTGLDLPIPDLRRVGVVGLKGGSGKTTVSVLIAASLARARTEPVLVFDTDTRFGSLSLRAGAVPIASVTDLARMGDPGHLSVLAGALGRSPDGVWILPSGRDPGQSARLSAEIYDAAMSAVYRHFPLLVTDCGAGLATALMARVLQTSHALVLTTTTGTDGLATTSNALSWLRDNGYQALAARSIVVLTRLGRRGADADLEAARSMFAGRAGLVLGLPDDPHLALGSAIDLSALAPATVAAGAEIAAAALAASAAAG